MNLAGLAAGSSLILIGVFAFLDYSSFSIENWRTLFFALTMVAAGSIGIIVEFYPFKLLDTWFKLVTCWPGKAMYYMFWGLITWDYSNSEIISNGDKWKISFSIVIVCAAGIMLTGWMFACDATAICEKSKFDDDNFGASSSRRDEGSLAPNDDGKKKSSWFGGKSAGAGAEAQAAKAPEAGPKIKEAMQTTPNKVETPSWQPAWTKPN